jgi:phage tail-like protein
MQVTNLRAEADPRGGRIRLSWTTPQRADFARFRGVKVVRRERSFPDARQVAEGEAVYLDTTTEFGRETGFVDSGLDGGTNYYYAVAAFDDDTAAPSYYPAFVSALATSPFGTAEQLYASLPAIYQRFDTLLPPAVPRLDPRDASKGQLRRLLEMFGLQFDLLRSYAAATRDFTDVNRLDGALLPLLSQWLGWPTDYSLPFDKQRGEIRYAPHFYRTTGIAANLRATLNRLTTWNAEIKEFVHNVFVANDPEQRAVWESVRHAGQWGAPRTASLHTAYEGRAAAVAETAAAQWLFYHATQKRQRPRGQDSDFCAPGDFAHVWFKLWDFDRWTPAQPVTFRDAVCKYPSAVRRKADGSFWVFYNESVEQSAGRRWRLRLNLLAAGRPAAPARLCGKTSGPFSLAEDDRLEVTLIEGVRFVSKTVVFHREHFGDIKRATAAEVAVFLDRELPGVEVTVARDETILLKTLAAGAGLQVKAEGSATTKLGLPDSAAGADATQARLGGSRQEPFALAHGDTLSVRLDGGPPRAVTFQARNFNDIGQATAAEVAAAVRAQLPRAATGEQGRVVLLSPTEGEGSSVVVEAHTSNAAAKLGLGVAHPAAQPDADDGESAAFEDAAGGVWLFWSSRRGTGGLRIWYNRFDGQTWGTSRALTSGATADREPFVLFEEAAGRVWVFWTGRRADGRRNVFWRTTTNLNFAAHNDSVWAEHELTVAPGATYDNSEPAGFVSAVGRVELYFTSNRAGGTQVWSNAVTPSAEQADVQVTDGPFTRCAPAAVGLRGDDARLWFRSNETQVYDSRLYPAARTFDARYSGSTLIDTGNRSKFGVSGRFKDTLHYFYDTGRGNDDWYARDTVGVYLTPDTDDEALVIRKRSQIESLLRSFLPMQVRAVVIIQQVFSEVVYNYEREQESPRLIGERWYDSRLGEVYAGADDRYADAVSFHWFRLWQSGRRPDAMPDLKQRSPDLSARLFLRDVKEGD